MLNPIESVLNLDVGIIKIPKSVNLFELFVKQVSEGLKKDGMVICSFMTKYFTPKLLQVASKYFEVVEQSKAYKKSRLLILSSKKEINAEQLIHKLHYKGVTVNQYYGVFSGNNIDYATQFLLNNLTIRNEEIDVLDLACGNGIIGKYAQQINPNLNLTLLDDSYLALASAKLNIKIAKFIHDFNLDQIDSESLDLVISNPPFHFEYEINISVPLGLFTQVARCLKPNGRFLFVANNHLQYLQHLKHKFSSAIVKLSNKKYTIYECIK